MYAYVDQLVNQYDIINTYIQDNHTKMSIWATGKPQTMASGELTLLREASGKEF